MCRASLAFVLIAWLCVLGVSAGAAAKSLTIYFIDVEGGQSTLIVDPQGESLLIDAGWPDLGGRDPGRIMNAAKAAGIDHIDDLIITHYHPDHVGGVAELANRIGIETFLDHGANMDTSAESSASYATYEDVAAKSKRVIVKPSDTIPFTGMSVMVLTAAGAEISTSLPGAGRANLVCASEPNAPADPGENARSVGVLITFGKFRFIDLGDLTNQKERALACPRNLIGTVDLYLITHHGTAHPGTGDSSNSPALVDALHPRVAVMDNGAIKGGHPVAWQTVHDSPGLEDLWQLHYSIAGGTQHNSREQFIANVGWNDEGNYIKVSAELDGTFTIVNSRNNFQKTYRK
jgi:competence protein ComEC